MFSARSGAAVVTLGVAKLTLALLFGGSLLTLLAAFPRCILGAMLALAGALPGLTPPLQLGWGASGQPMDHSQGNHKEQPRSGSHLYAWLVPREGSCLSWLGVSCPSGHQLPEAAPPTH
jgi:hypothetical protein